MFYRINVCVCCFFLWCKTVLNDCSVGLFTADCCEMSRCAVLPEESDSTCPNSAFLL